MSETDVRQPSLKELAARYLGAPLSPLSDLESRIRAMARRWQYTDAELADVLARASKEPAAWMRAVAIDERREQEFRERGLLPKVSA